MSKEFLQNKYNVGDIVYAKASPDRALVIRRYVDRVYYCKIRQYPEEKELVYFDRELVPNAKLALKNETERPVRNNLKAWLIIPTRNNLLPTQEDRV